MKHKSILYTCVGLMGAAAVMGFADYHYASKAGLFDELYAEDERVLPAALVEKELEMEDYSRAAFEYSEEQSSLTAETKDGGKGLPEELPPPPPPAPAPPAAPLLNDEPGIAPEADLPAPPPALETTPAPPALPAPPAPPVKETGPDQPSEPPMVEEVKEVNTKSFSRAPLRKKKIAVVKKI